MEKAIAVRFYENKRFGNTYGKGLYHKAVFNATADVQQPKAKYLLDMYSYRDWINTAKTDAEMGIIAAAADLVEKGSEENFLSTFLKRLNVDGTKPKVDGFGMLNLETGKLVLVINDEETGLEEIWQLEVKPCKQSAQNKNSPQMLAANIDLI